MYEQKFPNVDDIVMVNKIIKKFSVKYKKWFKMEHM
jgi:hypothetical protein